MNVSEIEPAALAERSCHAYLTLPDADAIARSTHPAASVSKAVKLIQAAQNEAWRIRLEMAKSWDENTLARVTIMVEAKVGKVPYAIRNIHPVTGPLNVARFPHGPWAKMRDAALSEVRKEHAQKRKEAKKPGAQSTNELKERKWMIECVERYVQWASKDGSPLGLESVEKFQDLPGKSIERARDLLRTLIKNLKQHSSNEATLEELKLLREIRKEKVWQKVKDRQKARKPAKFIFKNPTLDAVAECLRMLKKDEVG